MEGLWDPDDDTCERILDVTVGPIGRYSSLPSFVQQRRLPCWYQGLCNQCYFGVTVFI